jgi:hypothetical protein
MLDVDPTNNTSYPPVWRRFYRLDPCRRFIALSVRLVNDGVASAPGSGLSYVNLVGRKGNYRMCAFEGESDPIGMVFEGNPLNIHLETPFPKIWQALEDHGFGHHWMTVYDHLVPALEEFCRICKIEGVFPDNM